MRAGAALGAVGAAGTGTAVAAAWVGVFGAREWLPVGAGAAAASVLTGVLSARSGIAAPPPGPPGEGRALQLGARVRRRTVSVLLPLAGLITFCVLVLGRGRPRSVIEGLLDAPAQMLSYSLPLIEAPSAMAVPTALLWPAGHAAGRSIVAGRAPLVAYAGWMLAFLLGSAVAARGTTSAPPPLGEPALALAVLAGLLVVAACCAPARKAAGPPSSDGESALVRVWRRSAAPALLVTAVLGAVVLGAAAPLPREDPAAAARRPALVPTRTVTPITLVGALRASPDAASSVVLDVQVQGEWTGYVALADLDRYDGDAWTFRRDFRPSGGVVPPEPDTVLQAPPVAQRYTVREGLDPTAWLPHLGRVQRVRGVGVDVDAESGLAVPRQALRDGTTYDVVSRAPTTTLATLPADAAPSWGRPATETALPPSVLGRVAASSGLTERPECDETRSSALDCLRAVETALRSGYSRAAGANPGDRSAPGAGTSLADVTAAVLGPRRSGTPEQFASLFAVLARDLGVPARVVSGFRVRDADGRRPLPPGSRRIRAVDAWTWAEIPVAGHGWVVADPTPDRTGAAAPPPPPAVGTRPSPTPTPTSPELVAPDDTDRAVAAAAPAAPPGRPGGRGPLLLPAALVAGLAFAGVTLVVLRVRAGHRAEAPVQRIGRVWIAAVSEIERYAGGRWTSSTGTEITAAVHARFGPPAAASVDALASLAERLVFAPDAGAGEDDVARAEAELRALRRELQSRSSWRRRFAAPAGGGLATTVSWVRGLSGRGSAAARPARRPGRAAPPGSGPRRRPR